MRLATMLLAFGLTALGSSQPRVGYMIHFPSKLPGIQGVTEEQWQTAVTRLKESRLMVPKGTRPVIRFDWLHHEGAWFPDQEPSWSRNERVVREIAAAGGDPLAVATPHPWPSSPWYQDGNRPPWGSPLPSVFGRITETYAHGVSAYRSMLKGLKIPETRAFWQWGNEPANGHPGGADDSSIPRGTWTGHALWARLHATGTPVSYGGMPVLAPAISMIGEGAAEQQEFATVVPPSDYSGWTAPVTRWSLHHRLYGPHLPSEDAYADAWIQALNQRSARVRALAWPSAPSPERQITRTEAVAVTECYVVKGDNPGSRAKAFGAIVKRLGNLQGVSLVIFYRLHPEEGYQSEFALGEAERSAIKVAFGNRGR